MRITFILPQVGTTGGMRVVATYADRLQRRGHDVQVVSTPAKPMPVIEKLRYKKRGWKIPDPNRKPRSYFDDLDVPHNILDRFRPVTDRDVPDADAVIATWWETAEWVHRLSPSKGAKVFFIQHDESTFDHQPTKRVLATWRLPMAKITISQWLVDLARRRDPASPVFKVLNSVDTDLFHAEPRGRQPVPTIGLLYHYVGFKGVDVSLRAINRLAERMDRLKLLTFGVTDPVDALPLPPFAEHVTRPEQQHIRDIYSRCDVWLCGSRAEGFHLPPLEAMACRCPVVSTRVGGPMDIIQDGRNGYLADVEDDAALADHLERVLNQTETQWRVMSDAAWQTATDYTWEHATERFEQSLQMAHTPNAILRQSSGVTIR